MAATRNMVGERIKSLARLTAIERMRRPAVRPSAMDSIPDKGDDVESLCAALPELLGSERHEQRALSRRRRAISPIRFPPPLKSGIPVRSQPRMFGARGCSGDRDPSTAQLENASIDG
jgi:hypothetical protein